MRMALFFFFVDKSGPYSNEHNDFLLKEEEKGKEKRRKEKQWIQIRRSYLSIIIDLIRDTQIGELLSH